MRLAFVNNYPMDKAWEDWVNRRCPGQHLWGVTHLHNFGIEVDILQHSRLGFLKMVGKRVFGDVDQQMRLFLARNRYDVIYSASQYNIRILAWLRYMGWFGVPIISIVHHPLKKSFLNRLFLLGHDRLLWLSRRFADDARRSFGGLDRKSTTVKWGVDLDFYDFHSETRTETREVSVLSAGKCHRDYDTLVHAMKRIGHASLRIYCSQDSVPTVRCNDRVEVIAGESLGRNAISYDKLVGEYMRTRLVAVPLKEVKGLAGLTSLFDAMAMGKAVVMTRNPGVNIDIEKEGFGIWVEPGDIRGWEDAISMLLSNPKKVGIMGKRARSICESRFSLEGFSGHLAEIVAELA